tara:strand:- start:7440 stop:10904 length:3465 start_codon:yes stop_codon:yes gene_type:complete
MSSPFEKSFIANRVFTNRDGFKMLLQNILEKKLLYNERSIDVIYGEGGQGKSYLKNIFLVQECLIPMREENADIIFCDNLDFENDEVKRQPVEAYLAIAKTLTEQGNIYLPAFTLGLLKYLSLTSTNINLKESYPFLYSLKGKEIYGNQKLAGVLESIFDFSVNVVSENTPLVGSFIKKMVDDDKDQVVQWLKNSEVSYVLKDIDKYDKITLLNLLPQLLGYDVFVFLKEQQLRERKKQKRIIIILDGYETLWKGEKRDNLLKDTWIRKLMYYMTGVSFIVFGRDRLRWDEVEKDTGFIADIKHHYLKGFSYEDADSFLKNVPIEDPLIRNAIVCNSIGENVEDGYLPFYLDLEVSTYEEILKNEKIATLKDFENGSKTSQVAVLMRFFLHVPDYISNIIGILSLTNYFNQNVINELEVHDIISTDAVMNIESLLQYSFVKGTRENMNFHSLLKEFASESLQKNNAVKFKKTHSVLLNYYEKLLLSELKSKTISEDKIENYLNQFNYHSSKVDLDTHPNRIMSVIWEVLHLGQLASIPTILEESIAILRKKITEKDSIEDSSVKIEILVILNLLYAIGYYSYNNENYLYSMKYSEECLMYAQRAIDKNYHLALPKEKNISQLKSIIQYVYLLNLKLKVRTGKIGESEKVFLQLQEYNKSLGLELDPVYVYNYFIDLGRLSEAEPFFFEQYNDHLVEGSEHDCYIFAGSLSRIFRSQQRIEECLHYLDLSISHATTAFGNPSLEVMEMKLSKASVLAETKRNVEEAKLLLNEIGDYYGETLPEIHNRFGLYYEALFQLMLGVNYEIALEYFNKTCQITTPLKGAVNDSYLRMLIMHGEYAIDNNKEKSKLFSDLLALFTSKYYVVCQILSIYDPMLHRGILVVTKHLNKIGEKGKAEVLTRCLKEYKRIIRINCELKTSGLKQEQITANQRKKILKDFSRITSLPHDSKSLVLHRFNVPFYKTYDLYRMEFTNDLTGLVFYKYIFYNGHDGKVVNWSSELFHDINLEESELDLDTVSAFFYLYIFVDFLGSNDGKFYSILKEDEIPWRLDIEIEPKVKEGISKIFQPIQLIKEEEDAFFFEVFIHFIDRLFKATFKVNRLTGLINMEDDEPIHMIKYEGNVICDFETDLVNLGIDFEKAISFEKRFTTIEPIYND